METVEYECPNCGGTDFSYDDNPEPEGDFVDHFVCGECHKTLKATYKLVSMEVND